MLRVSNVHSFYASIFITMLLVTHKFCTTDKRLQRRLSYTPFAQTFTIAILVSITKEIVLHIKNPTGLWNYNYFSSSQSRPSSIWSKNYEETDFFVKHVMGPFLPSFSWVFLTSTGMKIKGVLNCFIVCFSVKIWMGLNDMPYKNSLFFVTTEPNRIGFSPRYKK